MTADDQTIKAAAPQGRLRESRRRLRAIAHRGLRRIARPYARLGAADASLAAAQAGMDAKLEHLATRHGEQIERLEDLVCELVMTAETLRRTGAQNAETAAWARRTVEPIAAELYSLPYMAGSPFERIDTEVGEALGFRSASAVSDGDTAYVAFEDLFRGPPERVAELQVPYLSLVRDHQPVLDVGCGRGEFLGLLAREGIAATGVDSDPGMVRRCSELGLDAELGDGNTFLKGLQDGSLGTVFSAQVIEHLPHAELHRMLELALRKLRPGGLFIAETVNPHRISSLKTFWVDLSHQHPIFPEVALAACAIAGFRSAYVFAPTFESFESARFSSPAYAVVAAAPEPVQEPLAS
jgi:2-polyprenyl-3-methyl-5-hydroxy-6-metoxy-1,4-benzoquinol methylase